MTPQPTYFGGSTVKGGRIRKLNARSFKELLDNYVFIPVQFHLTRAEFLAHPDRDKLKDGPYICACSYDFEEGHREDFTATAVNMVILDLDEGDFVKDFFESPDTISEALHPFNFVCWTTAKHTPEAPRLKIAVEVRPCAPDLHRRFVSLLISRLGLPDKFKGVRESKTLSLPQYRPIQFAGEEFDAIVASRTTGIAACESDLLPETETETGRTYACDQSDELIGLGFLPCAGLSVEDIREPLFAIDPDCEYQAWTHIACGLRHQFMQDEDEAREAYLLFDEWSSGGSKYKGEEETYGKWVSFKPYVKGRNPRTIRSLFKLAIEAGWETTKVATKVKESAEAWIASCGGADVLMNEGAKRIADMPFKNAIVEEALILKMQAALKGYGVTIDKATIRKQVASARFRDRTESVREEKPNWMKPFCFIGPENVFHNVSTGVRYSPDAFNNTFSRYLTPPKSDDSDESGTRPLVMPTHKALNEAKIQVVDGEIYDPREQGLTPFFELEGRMFVNTYLRSSVPIEETEHSDEAGALFCQHIRTIIPEPEYQDILIDFCCHLVQFPGRKIRWCALIQSAEGVGKGFLGKILMAVLGKQNVKVISPEVLRSQWNDWMACSVLAILDEIHMPGQVRETVMNALKMGISDDYLTINKRNTSARDMPNLTNFLGYTNFLDALHLKPSDRRWFVLQSAIQTVEQVAELTATGYFERLEILLGPWKGALRHWMMHHRISPDFPVDKPAPKTRYREAVIENSKNPLQVRIEELVADPEFPTIGDDVIHYSRLEGLTEHLARHNAKVSHYLRGIGYELYRSAKFDIHGERTHLWVHTRNYFPELGEPDELIRMRIREL